jgi:hypothetical protein
MYMPFLMFRKKYFSEEAGGGGITVAIGIAQGTMITDGVIIGVIPLGTEEYLMIGDIVTATICGVVAPGILTTFIMVILIGTGVAVIGVMTMDGDIPAAATCTAVALVGNLPVDIPAAATCMAVVLVGSLPVDIPAGNLVGILVENPACSNQM